MKTKRLYVYCEGQTEEAFVNRVLYPYLQSMGVDTTPLLCDPGGTSRRKYKGGVSSYGKIKKELIKHCGDHRNEMITTMFDLYAFPPDTPGIDNNISDIYEKAEHIEKAIMDDIDNWYDNMFFNLVLHEFEGLLFSDVSAFEDVDGADSETIADLRDIRASVKTPEHINGSTATAPSKRIEGAIPGYSKVVDGVDVAEEIGIDKISSECKHFERWIAKITDWAKRDFST